MITQNRFAWFILQCVSKVILESSTKALLAEAKTSFEVLMPPHLEHIIFHGTFETLDAIESLLRRNATGAYLRFGDGEARASLLRSQAPGARKRSAESP